MQTYVNLHQHSQNGSFLDGYSTPESNVKRAAKIGMSAIGCTEHGEVSSHLAYQKAGLKYGVKIVYGMESYLVDSIARVREEKDRKNSHFCVFAENQQGLSNLWKLSTLAYTEGRYYKPLVDWEMLKGNTEGLIVTDGCMLAYMARAILEDTAESHERIVQLIGQYVDTFGEDNFFMELHTWQFIFSQEEIDYINLIDNDFSMLNDPKWNELVRRNELNQDMAKINRWKVHYAKKYDIPLIVVNDAHYAEEHEWEHHALVWKMSTFGDDKTEPGKTASWIMTDDEVHFWMAKHRISRDVVQEAIENTARIAARCNVTIEPTGNLPSITGTDGGDLEYFLDKIDIGLKELVIDKGLDPQPYIDQLENEEFPILIPKKFYKYLNVVEDAVSWAKNEAHMLVGPGRGSAAGSVAVWLMKITAVDPLKYNLLFSRFLTSGRKGNPDIDIDIPQSRRGEFISYIVKKYGADCVAGIGTLSRSAPRGILKDLCRAMSIPFDDVAAMTSIIEQVKDIDDEDSLMSWDEILKSSGGDLAKWANKYPNLFAKMGDMIGIIRQSSAHASGILISSESLLGKLPLRVKGDSDWPVSQFENSETAGDTEIVEMGYEKDDFLGLRHLDTLEIARTLVKERHGVWLDYYNWTDEQFADPNIWERPNKGDTLGLFQIETSSASAISAQFNIENERDVAALISVNRPGVIDAGQLAPFLRRRAGTEMVKSPHKMMDEVLSDTFSICVYQEQIMRLCQVAAQYTLEEADGIRKDMGKKLMDKLKAKKTEFIEKCCANHTFTLQLKRGEKAEVIAGKIWDNIEPAGRYAFNLSHAVAYSFITCWEAWVRHYYPKEFMTALMISDPGKVPAYVGWCKKNNIAILPPDINDSDKGFKLTDEGIRYGLTTVMHVGEKSYDEIAQKRPFDSFEDMYNRMSKGGLNARVGENLISIGALDRWGPREVLLGHFYTQRKIKDKEIPNFYDDVIVGQIEKKLVGSYITKDPTDKFAAIIEKECLQTAEEMNDLFPAEIASVGGLVVKVKPYKTKKGSMMAWISIEWRGELFELVMFPDSYKAYKYFVEEDTPVICQVERLNKGASIRQFLRLDRM